MVVYPGGDANSPIKDIQAQPRIPSFSTLLTFFEDFVFLAESLPPALIQIGPPYRFLNEGPEFEFLISNRLSYVFRCLPDQLLWEATKVAQESFAKGPIYTDDFRGIIDTESTRSRDVFVSKFASDHFPEKSFCLNVEFIQGLSVPAPDVPWEDILRFREKRRGEYSQFWWTIFDAAARIDWVSSNNPESELRERVLKRLEDFERISSETWARKVRDSISLRVVVDRASVAMAFGATGSSLVLPDPVAVSLGILGFVKFSIELAPAPSPMPQGASGMSFLSRVRAGNFT